MKTSATSLRPARMFGATTTHIHLAHTTALAATVIVRLALSSETFSYSLFAIGM
jgi:hypothetical protein